MNEAQAVSVRQLKREIADCLIYLPAHLASFLVDDIKAVQALVLILHRNLLTAREDRKRSLTVGRHNGATHGAVTATADFSRTVRSLSLSVRWIARRAC